MALTLTKTTPAPGPTKLDPKKWGDCVRNYIAARAQKKQADADSRAADKVLTANKELLLEAIGPAAYGICGHAVLTPKTTSGAEAALTLRDGTKVVWSAVSGLTIGNKYVAAEDVQSIYGGRSESRSIEVAGEP